jgi:hypothetical protein
VRIQTASTSCHPQEHTNVLSASEWNRQTHRLAGAPAILVSDKPIRVPVLATPNWQQME